MLHHSCAILLFVILNVHYTFCTNSCTTFKTCGECIGNNLSCVWCPDDIHKQPRCESLKTVQQAGEGSWCKSIVNPEQFQNVTTGSGTLKPQHVHIKARPGDKLSFKMTYKPNKDSPVDIYYLMDNSYTMSFHKDSLQEQAEKIYKKLVKISNNVQFGVGSYVEKMALPYVNPDETTQQYNTFINHLSLTGNISEFTEVVKKVKHQSNYDIPECALDALMQIMVCDAIKWRKEARRIIILGTDATYHSAGDGKMVGAYKPNDMKCHLKDNKYELEASLLYDYPSVSQISKVASENNFNIVFTTLNQVEQEYQALTRAIQGAFYVELKKIEDTDPNKGSDLVNKISDLYLKLVHTLILDPGNIPPHIEVVLDPPCKDIKDCEIPQKGSKSIDVTIHIKNCSSERGKKDTLEINSLSSDDILTVDVEVLCNCDCEKKENGKNNSEVCSSSGTYHCGICKCNDNSYGNTCQCVGKSTEEEDLVKCGLKADAKPCSGRGQCICGECKNCSSGYLGDHCDYGKHDCLTVDDKVCADNGECRYKKCECFSGWKGTDCTCSTDEEPCLGNNMKVCSGNGECSCGKCICTKVDSNNKKYTGAYCDVCDDCVKNRCKELENYVDCYYNKENDAECVKELKDQLTSNRTVLLLNRTEIKASKWVNTHWCTKVYEDQSSIRFKYLDGRNHTLILIQKEKDLPPEPDIWTPIGSVIGAILLVGLLTVIIWKVLVDRHDAKEYRKFAEESQASGFVITNPLYQAPGHCVINPAFNQDFNQS